MEIYRNFDDIRLNGPDLARKRPVVTIGNLDGLHLGHQYLINELIQWGQQQSAPTMVITFRTHPRIVMSGAPATRLMSVEHKLALLRELGVGYAVVVEFDEELRKFSARDFCTDVLCGLLKARGLLLGYNNRIGRDQEGTPHRLQEIGRELDFELRVADRVEVSGSGISSSAIREHIEKGDFLWARKMLGRPYSIRGLVLRGAGRGRGLGFATLNLSLEGLAHPPLGVYGVRVNLEGKTWIGAANIGVRPTMENQLGAPILETHLIGFAGDCYGAEVDLEFVFRVREERRFAGTDELRKQIAADVKTVEEHFSGHQERVLEQGQ